MTSRCAQTPAARAIGDLTGGLEKEHDRCGEREDCIHCRNSERRSRSTRNPTREHSVTATSMPGTATKNPYPKLRTSTVNSGNWGNRAGTLSIHLALAGQKSDNRSQPTRNGQYYEQECIERGRSRPACVAKGVGDVTAGRSMRVSRGGGSRSDRNCFHTFHPFLVIQWDSVAVCPGAGLALRIERTPWTRSCPKLYVECLKAGAERRYRPEADIGSVACWIAGVSRDGWFDETVG